MDKSVPYIVIAAVVAAVATIGGMLTDSGMDWYRTLNLPAFTPPGGVIGMVWTAIFIMSALAVMLIWRARSAYANFSLIIWLLVGNGVLNVMWSWVFFVRHELGWAIVEMTVLNLTNLALIILNWHRQRVAALLFLPYFGWVCFATGLAVAIWRLN
ncbi:tryptophan-rich sensory protein [bacterium]|nr:tryptophan-rich sensory protein [bacterium]